TLLPRRRVGALHARGKWHQVYPFALPMSSVHLRMYVGHHTMRYITSPCCPVAGSVHSAPVARHFRKRFIYSTGGRWVSGPCAFDFFSILLSPVDTFSFPAISFKYISLSDDSFSLFLLP